MENAWNSRGRVSEETVFLRRRIQELEARLEEIASESREVRLLDELRRSRDALERRVEERTSDLMRINQQLTQEIEERKRVEEALWDSEQRFRHIYENAPIMLHSIDVCGVLRNVNQKWLTEMGFNREEVIGKTIDFIMTPESRQALSVILPEFWKEGKVSDILYSYIKKNGTIIDIVLDSVVIYDSLWGMVSLSVVRDITETKKAQESLTASLLEKEVLLREIHHRVKNNLQIVSSLLRLQSRFACDAVSREALAASEQRLYSMACVHESLYRSADLARIDFSRYVSDLASHLMACHGVADEISLEKNMEPVELGVDIAIPCGLIANELISNSLRHAFPQGRTGAVKIELKKKGGSAFDLIVRDNGIGLPSEMDFNSSPSFGSRLVQSLIRQVNGQMVIDGSGGTEFRVSFPGTGNGRH